MTIESERFELVGRAPEQDVRRGPVAGGAIVQRWNRSRSRARALGQGAECASSRAKRAFDAFAAAVALIAFLPLMLVIALLIKLESPGPVIFRQKRGGLMGSTFEIYKFRTMRVVESGAPVRHATKGDPRLTSIGAFLRKSSFDELPQLINVLKGEMSIVGPRPHAVAHDDYYADQIRIYRRRFWAKPGITGLAQVSGCRGEVANVEAMADRVALDLEYIENWTFLLDLNVVLMTLARLPFDPQAY